MSRTVEWYLYPRVCPILALSSEDLSRCIESYGRNETITTLSSLLVKNYDFPYARACIPRTPAPSTLGPPRSEGKPIPATATTLLGSYRCSRLGTEVKIPGITLIMRDMLSRLDWALDSFMEIHRMKCWVAIQGKTRKWAEQRSPYARATNIENLSKILDSDIGGLALLNHANLRDLLIGHCEAVPPTIELYLQTISKLNPTSITVLTVGYGVSLAAMACVVSEDLPCYYQLNDVTDEAARSMREFITTSGRNLTETESPRISDLMFIEIVPHGTHDLRSYLRRTSSYKEHLNRVFHLLRYLVDETPLDQERSPRRIVLVISLRELPALPTIEPLLLTILSDEKLTTRIQLVGSLVSNKRDYTAYLMLLHSTIRPPAEATRKAWEKRLRDNYPELLLPDDAVVEVKRPVATVNSDAWEVVCLNSALPVMTVETSNIAVQGPRILRGKDAFPTRTRNCIIVTETSDQETGNLVYVFGDIVEPPLIVPVLSEASPPPAIADSLLARMVKGIKGNMDTQAS